MALWEWLAERRPMAQPRPRRWMANVGISLLDTLLVRLLFPTAAFGVALLAEAEGWGLFHYFDTPIALASVASVVLLDLAIYLQHVMFHAVPALWRLHMVHHSDQDFDATTGIRFHPVEILLSLFLKFGVVVALGCPPVAVVVFEVLLNATSLFNHGNVRLAGALDRPLRWLVVTPDMHRVHHSVEVDESNSNFGFNLSLWDRLFGTYRAQPRAGHEAMGLGVTELLRSEARSLPELLALPFGRTRGRQPIGERWTPRVADEDGDRGGDPPA
ncbi:MAG: sterol desaturase family protein [Thermoanaerobaculia bacterium]|nr:sterol desaturase family protein [Thermoanaerobaculia bacterium]